MLAFDWLTTTTYLASADDVLHKAWNLSTYMNLFKCTILPLLQKHNFNITKKFYYV